MRIILIVSSLLFGFSAAAESDNTKSCRAFDWSKYELARTPLQVETGLNNADADSFISSIKASGQKYFKDNCRNIKNDENAISIFAKEASMACKSRCSQGGMFKSLAKDKGPLLVKYCQTNCAELFGDFYNFNLGFQAGLKSANCKNQSTPRGGYKWGESTQ